MYVKHLWTDNNKNTEQLLEGLKANLNKHNKLPLLIYVVSAGEANMLMEPQAIEFIAELSDRGHQIEFVGSACTSFHAAILSFSVRKESEAIILNLELGKQYQQDCLNALGIGTGPNQDGLEVVTGVAFTWVSKRYQTDHLFRISSCDILSQKMALNGTHELLKNIKQFIHSDEGETAATVSFDIRSDWAKGLLKGFSSDEKNRWLSSIEEDGLHYLSIKPLVEIQQYFLGSKRESVSDSGKSKNIETLWLITLGGGGRVGCLKVAKLDHLHERFLPRLVNIEQFSLEDTFAQFQLAASKKEELEDDYLSLVRTAMTYPNKQYRGRHNQVFHWMIEAGDWRSLLANQGAKHG